jgi:hypothetical protein
MTLKTTTTTPMLTITETHLPPRGKRKAPLPLRLLGKEVAPAVMDTTVLRGVPLEILVMHAAEEGLDPSEALGAGLNALKIERAKALAPGFVAQVAERLKIVDPTKARLTAMHITKLAKQSGRNQSDVLSALELTGLAMTE